MFCVFFFLCLSDIEMASFFFFCLFVFFFFFFVFLFLFFFFLFFFVFCLFVVFFLFVFRKKSSILSSKVYFLKRFLSTDHLNS